MPGWYVHLEAAHDTARAMRDGNIPPGFAITAAEAQVIGEHCHTWRNYLALGSLGPDLFYLLPDFKNTTGQVIRQVVQWALDVWEVIDGEFVSKWEKWIDPISTNNSQLSSQLTGGLSTQLAQVLDELISAMMSAFKGLLAEMGDWFGVLTSGVPQGFGDDAFYWSDMFHYRKTYQFPFVLFQQAQAALAAAATDDERKDAQARVAFAVGWMSHCATDVTGHPFTNAKSGQHLQRSRSLCDRPVRHERREDPLVHRCHEPEPGQLAHAAVQHGDTIRTRDRRTALHVRRAHQQGPHP